MSTTVHQYGATNSFKGGGGYGGAQRGGGGGGGGGRDGGGGGGGGGNQGNRVYNAHTARMIFDGKRIRKSIQRRTVDYHADIIRHMETRIWGRKNPSLILQPDPNYIINYLPPSSMLETPMNAVTTKFVHTSTNKMRCPVNVVRWTPEGRRLITGSSSGEFTLWNGLEFNFETILQAHDTAVRAMKWSHNDNWMVTADHTGYIKYWQSNMNNLKVILGHKEAIRGITFSPSDSKFASCSDDGTIKIWDFNEGLEEKVLTGHGWDVKCIDWHPYKALLASGSKDNLIKLWDPKSGKALSTLHSHKNTILSLEWNRNGNWLLSGSRDQLVKVYDIRMMKELQSFRGHKKEVNSTTWHPHHERLFSSGGSEGTMMFWLVGQDQCVGTIENAHESNIWSMHWHPVGHILVSGSNDHTTRFWARNRPGEAVLDRFVSSRVGESSGADHDVKEDQETYGGGGGGFMSSAMKNLGSVPGLQLASRSQATHALGGGRQTSHPIPGMGMVGQGLPHSADSSRESTPGPMVPPPTQQQAYYASLQQQQQQQNFHHQQQRGRQGGGFGKDGPPGGYSSPPFQQQPPGRFGRQQEDGHRRGGGRQPRGGYRNGPAQGGNQGQWQQRNR